MRLRKQAALASALLGMTQPNLALAQDASMDAMIENSVIEYVPMPAAPASPEPMTMKVETAQAGQLQTVQSVAASEAAFWTDMSRNRINMSGTGVVEANPSTNVSKDHKVLVFQPGMHDHVPFIGNAISAKHEAGHEFNLAHSHERIWDPNDQNKVTVFKNEVDPFDPMTTMPGVPSLNPPHVHFLKWFMPTEEAYLVPGNTYNLRVFFNRKSPEFAALKSLYYEVPNSSRKYWFSYQGYIRVSQGSSKFVPVFAIHSADAQGASTYYEGNIEFGKTHVRTGLVFEPVQNPSDTNLTINVSLDPSWSLTGN